MTTAAATRPPRPNGTGANENPRLAAALACAANGWAVFPQHTPRNGKCSCGNPKCNDVGKHPRIKDQYNAASRDESVIRAWWAKWPDANIGIATGAKSNGGYCLDFDVGGYFDAWRKAVGPLADTLPREERDGRAHVYLRADASLKSDVLAYADEAGEEKAIELRADKAAITASPSLHASGARYAFVVGSLKATPHVKPDELDRMLVAARKLNRKVKPELTQEQPEILTARDALQPQPPIEWICEPIVAEASVNVWAGDGGSGKTWTLLDLGANVASGQTHWLGMYKINGGPVLIVDEESGRRRILRRMNHVLTAIHAGPDTPLYCVSLNLFNLRERSGADLLASLIGQTGARLVIIDALADIMPGADENAVKDVHPVMRTLRQLAEMTGAAFTVIHHTAKGGGYRGSSSIKGAVENLVVVKKEPRANRITFTFDKERDGGPGEFAVEAHFEDDRFYLTSAEATPRTAKLGKPQRYVLRFIATHGESELGEIANKADTCSQGSARNAVYNLADLHLVERADVGGLGTKATYRFTAEGSKLAAELG